MISRNTTCPYCGVGCGVSAKIDKGQVIAVSGDEHHPANSGRLCVKGAALAETLGADERLLVPTLTGKNVSWDSALETITEKLRSTREAHGGDAIAFYLSGQLLTEDYYVANKLMKGFLGSANVDTNSRLCMSSAVAAYKRSFGADLVPCTYKDVEDSDLLVLVGSNAAWTHPVVYQRIVAAKQRNPNKRVVVIDTRRTASSDIADLYLQIAPGSDGFLFAGLLNYLRTAHRFDEQYIAAHTEGLQPTLDSIANLDEQAVLEATGLGASELTAFYSWFAETSATVTMYSQGINQSATGTDKCNAIINCHLATGRIGRPGAGPFSITGQPNAMGGREVGGLANQLAAHMDFEPADVDRVGRFWGAADMATKPGLKAVDMFQAAADGRIKFLWIMATNPVVSLPDSALVRKALKRCEFVVVSDCTANTDTAVMADLLLPAAGWGEKDGTVTNSERTISRQRSLVNAPGEAKPDWWAVVEVAKRLGFEDGFSYRGAADIFSEHAALSSFENSGARAFNIGALAGISAADYDQLAPTRWPFHAGEGQVEPLSDGRFYTQSGRGKFIPTIPQVPRYQEGVTVNTGRFRDQWHTMTRTGKVPKLARHRDFFSLSLSPADAAQCSLKEGDIAQLCNSQGAVQGLVVIDEGLPPGQVFVPIHWNDQFTGRGIVNDLIPAVTDPVSGQPQSKFCVAILEVVSAKCWGMLFTRTKIDYQADAYWSRIAVPGGYLTLLAENADPQTTLNGLLKVLQSDATEQLQYADPTRGDFREIGLCQGRLDYALFLNREQRALPQQNWLVGLGALPAPKNPHTLLSGLSAAGSDSGRMVCSCLEVGEKQIIAVVAGGAHTVAQVSEQLRCGTQCGSCIPELKQLCAARYKADVA